MESLEEVLEEVEICTKCPDLAPCRKLSKDAHGNRASTVVIINQFPDEKSHKKKEYWSNPAGEKLRHIFDEIEFDPEKTCYITDAVKCVPPGKRKPTDEEWTRCKPFLVREIELLKPKFLVTVGEFASKNILEMNGVKCDTLLKLHNENGPHYYYIDNRIIIPILHPSQAPRFMDFVLYRYHLKDVFTKTIEDKGFHS
jgi:DNA polymerase